jgi:predicted permease
MTLFHRLASVLRWILNRDQAEQRLDDEIQAYIEMSAADKVRDGLTPDQARRLAILELGGIEPAKERVRTYRHGGWLDDVGRDVRYAIRMFVRNPGFTATAVLTLTLGIGANTAIFSLIDALMLRWLPVRSPQELVQISYREPGTRPSGSDSLSYAIVGALDEQREIFAGVAGFSGCRFEVGPQGSIARVRGALVTGGFYETLGLQPALGRLLTREDDRAGAPLVAVISHGYWERQFARDAGVVGQNIRIGGIPVTIVGVSPPGFVGADVGSIADITMTPPALRWVNPRDGPLLSPGNFWLRVLARPRTGIPPMEAAARLNALWPRISDPVIARYWPAPRRKALAESVFYLSPGGTGWTNLRDVYRKPLFVLMAVVGLVLLVACANVASLLLARAASRQKEIAIRLAIGAGRGRIVRQLLIESVLLSAIGAALGVELAWLCGRLLVDLISTGPSEIVLDLTPNWRVLAFTSTVAVATCVLFGLAPALQATVTAPSAVLKESASAGRSRSRLLQSLVSAQVALSLVLLAGAGLFVRTLQNLQNLDPGFSADGVLLVEFDRGGTVPPGELLDEVRRVPGVLSASLTTHTPLSGSTWSEPAVPAGQRIPDLDNAFFIGAGPRFFETMQIQLLSGRDFASQDTTGGPEVAIVNEAYALRHFPGRNPLGQRLSSMVRGAPKELEIVGLVRNTNIAGLRKAPPPTVYVAYEQLKWEFSTTLAVRAAGRLTDVASEIQRALQPRLLARPIEVRPLSAQVEVTLIQERMMATLASGFGLLALILACVGLYGLLAYTVAQRTKEIGIRMALGAQRKGVVSLILKGGIRLVLIGIALGVPAAWLSSRWVASMLFGLTPTDPPTIAGAILMLAAAAQVAAYFPARRASRQDPLTALRHD